VAHSGGTETCSFGSLLLNRRTGELTRTDGKIVLSGLLRRLLLYLIDHRTRMVSREELAMNIWDINHYGRDEKVTRAANEKIAKAIGRLRDVLGHTRSQYIDTIRSKGYQFVAFVTSLPKNVKAPKPRLLAIDFGSDDPDAIEAFTRGRFHWNRRQLHRAAEWFRSALARDPSFAKCRAALAETYVLLGSFGYESMAPQVAMPLAEAAAREAVAADAELAEAYTALGAVHGMYYWNFAAAQSYFRQAFACAPHYATAHHWYANFLAARGDFTTAKHEISVARTLNPLSLVTQSTSAWICYFERDFNRGIEAAREALEMDARAPHPHVYMALNYLGSKDFVAAIESLLIARRTAASGSGYRLLPELGYAYAMAGQTIKARRILRQLLHPNEQYVAPYHVAKVYLGLGEVDEVFGWLERAFEAVSPSLIVLKVDQIFDPLRHDRRHGDLMRRVGYWAS
jgi:DNA-binding winged helix-turn-helix (wHTH) protein